MRETIRGCNKHVATARSDTLRCDASDSFEDETRGSYPRPKGHGPRVGAASKGRDFEDREAVQAAEAQPCTDEVESPGRTVERVQDFVRRLCQVR